jgi:hypothetical protein
VLDATRAFLVIQLICFRCADHSAYLPLCLFLLMQGCALLQHRFAPYRQSADNLAELCSLYLLIVLYLTAVIVSYSRDVRVGPWIVCVLGVNVVFIAVMVVRVLSPAAATARSLLNRRSGSGSSTSSSKGRGAGDDLALRRPAQPGCASGFGGHAGSEPLLSAADDANSDSLPA